jgi:predicted nucleotidyltransferase
MSDAIQPPVLEMLAALEPILQKLDIDFYIVGAIARDIQLGEHINTRKTKDVDIAIRVGDETQYIALKKALTETGDFEPHPTEAIKVFYKSALEIDLLPFGDIENENREIQLYDPTLFVINMPGFKEAYPFVTELEVSSGQTLKICSLEGLVMLKLIAYGDNPSRTKDVTDIDHIIENYFDLFQNNVYDEHFDVMDMYNTEDREYLALVSARVIGRNINVILDNDDQLIERIIKTLGKRPTKLWQSLASGLND